jgi:hypothetical protein
MRGRISIAVAEGGSITPDQCREARVQLGVTQERLPELSGVGQSYVSSFERIGRVLTRGRGGIMSRKSVLRSTRPAWSLPTAANPGVKPREPPTA